MNTFHRFLALICFYIISSGYINAQFDDGVYYILNTSTDMYLGSTGFNGARAILIKHGHPFVFTGSAVPKSETETTDESETETEDEMTVANDSVQQMQYIIDSHFFSSEETHYLGKNIYLDEEPMFWRFVETKDGNYAITCDGRNYLASDGASTSVVTVANMNHRRAQWKIIKETDRIDAFKGEDDATFLIRNANFFHGFGPAYEESYWTINSASNEKAVNLSGGSSTEPCGVASHTTFDISQDVEGIPCGTYALQAQCFYRLDGTRTSYIPELYLDEESETYHLGTQNESSDKDASGSFASNLYDVKGLKTTTYCGKIVVGTRLERSEKLRSYWDNFKLTYVKDLDLDGYKKAYVESIKEAELTLEKQMNVEKRDSILAILQNKDTVVMTIESIKPFVNTLNKARAEGNRSAKEYNDVLKAYEVYTSLDERGQAMFMELASGIKADYDNGIIANGRSEIKELYAIYLTSLKSQITPGTDMTDAIVNPDVDGSTGWTCERPHGGNGPLLNNVSFEYWAGNSIKLEDRSFNYYQTVTGLQNGKYTVSCMAYNSMSSNDTEFYPSCGLYASNGKDTVNVYVEEEGNKYSEYTTPEIQAIDGQLTIGVRNFTTMPARWFVADDFRLTLVSPDPALDVANIGNDEQDTIIGIYSVDGVKRKEPEAGLNIIKYRSGKVVKKLK